jgi:hypothetical protein
MLARAYDCARVSRVSELFCVTRNPAPTGASAGKRGGVLVPNHLQCTI